MRFREALQVRLQERYRRLAKSDYLTFETNVRLFLAWLGDVPALDAMVAAVNRSEPELDPDEWWQKLTQQRRLGTPQTEEARAKIVMSGLHDIAYTPGVDFRQTLRPLTNQTDYNGMVREFCSQWIEPVIEYLQERLAVESDILYLLERYRRQVAWFDLADLYERYVGDTKHGEQIYESHLRQFLFMQGVDYPYSQPVGPSGRPDVIALAETDDPLTCEIKLFDGRSRGVSHLAQGVQQAYRYATDYGKVTAYLVVFNLTDRPLEFPSDDADAGWPPRLDVAGVTIFLIAIQAKPLRKASQAGKAKPRKMRRSSLVDSWVEED